MAKDITIRVTGQNPDGTLNVSQVGGDGNPFMAQPQSTAMAPYNASAGNMAPAAGGGFRAKLGNVEVNFASEADFLKADKAIREMVTVSNVPTVGSMGGSGGIGGMGGGMVAWLRTGAEAAGAVGSFLAARGIRRKIEDVETALEDSRSALSEMDQLSASGKYPDLIPILRRALIAERDATESHLGAFDDQLTAMDIQTGAGVAKVVSEFMTDRPGTGIDAGGGGMGSALAIGGVGLGLGYLATRDTTSTTRGRRRR